MGNETCLPCRHTVDMTTIERLGDLLKDLHTQAPELLKAHGVPTDVYPELFRGAVESIRGTFAATIAGKKKFIEAILERMQTSGHVARWEFVGTGGRQDYRVELGTGRLVSIEAKGCPDGNNTTIWTRPDWADEFVVWCQCPESFRHQPGTGVWKGLANRLFPKILRDGQLVDAFVFYDARCGSALRPCPKMQGLTGLRATATPDIEGQEGRDWLPPPSVYLLPRQKPHPVTNPSPLLHDLTTCLFAPALLRSFNVPDAELEDFAFWSRLELRRQRGVDQFRVSIGLRLRDSKPAFQGGWRRVRY